MRKSVSLPVRIRSLFRPLHHPQQDTLIRILTGKTSVSSSGFPYISETSFRAFLQEVPHLFRDGHRLLDWLLRAEEMADVHAKSFAQAERESVRRALQVIRQVVYSAAICAPPDLWILKHVLSVHCHSGLLPLLRDGKDWWEPAVLAQRLGVEERHLRWDLSFLYCRGLLRWRKGKYTASGNPQTGEIFRRRDMIPEKFLRDMTEPIRDVLSGKSSGNTKDLVSGFLSYRKNSGERRGWFPAQHELDVGYRIVPLILATQAFISGSRFEAGTDISSLLPGTTEKMRALLSDAGMIYRGKVTDLGVRVLERGPGPFGIIHAYVPYMKILPLRLCGKGGGTRVNRLKNIAASQQANRKTFQMANDCLDRFCREHHFHYTLFLEHALGQGEATRQRLQRNGEGQIQYFGADLEDAAIDRAIVLQQKGVLPANMIFIRAADIANPNAIVDTIRSNGFSTRGAVMMVGNGFHEIRGQTNQKVIEIFRGYSESGILLIFTEESALSDSDLLATAWNTYHAGFRFVHELSGQGLRPAMGTDPYGRYSWKICAALGGYAVLSRYSAHTRTIFPYPRKGGHNPPISMTYFCVPARMAHEMGFYPSHWSVVQKLPG